MLIEVFFVVEVFLPQHANAHSTYTKQYREKLSDILEARTLALPALLGEIV